MDGVRHVASRWTWTDGRIVWNEDPGAVADGSYSAGPFQFFVDLNVPRRMLGTTAPQSGHLLLINEKLWAGAGRVAAAPRAPRRSPANVWGPCGRPQRARRCAGTRRPCTIKELIRAVARGGSAPRGMVPIVPAVSLLSAAVGSWFVWRLFQRSVSSAKQAGPRRTLSSYDNLASHSSLRGNPHITHGYRE